MKEKIISEVTEHYRINNICNELKKLNYKLTINNINYKDIMDDLINDSKIATMLDKILINQNLNYYSDEMILELLKYYREHNKEDDADLIKLLTNKTKENQNIIIKLFEKYIMKKANQFKNHGVDFDDLVQVGRIALLDAYIRYDIEKNTKFITYASSKIIFNMIREIRIHGSLIKLPYEFTGKLYNIEKFESNYYIKYGKKPSIKEISVKFNIEEEQLQELLLFLKPFESLDRPIDNDNCIIGNIIPDVNPGPEEIVEKRLLKEDLYLVMKKIGITQREKEFIMLYYCEENKYEEISKKYNITRERVRQIVNSGMNKLIKSVNTNALASYLDDIYVAQDLPSKNEINIEEKKTSKIKPLYETFGSYDTSNLKCIINNLPDDYKKIVYKKYGIKLDGSGNNWTNKEQTIYYYKIRPLIISELSGKKINDYRGYFTIAHKNKDKLKQALIGMYPEYIDVIKKRYGDNFDEKNDISKKEHPLLSKATLALYRRYALVEAGRIPGTMQRRLYEYKKLALESLLENSCTEEEIFNLSKIVKSDSFKDFLYTYDSEIITIFSVIFDYGNEHYDIETALNVLNIDEDRIIKTIRNVLNDYSICRAYNESLVKPIQKILHII